VPRSNTGGNEGAPDEYAPPRTTINASLFKRIPMGPELFLRVENIFDETNVTYGYWPGRQVYAGVKYTVN